MFQPRCRFTSRAVWVITLAAVVAASVATAKAADARQNRGPYQATGFKVGEVTDTSATVWTRLTARPKPNPGPTFVLKVPEGAPPLPRDAASVAELPAAVPGAAGEVRVRWRMAKESSDSAATGTNADWQSTEWRAVDPQRDFTRQIKLEGLKPASQYEIAVETRNAPDSGPGQTLEGRFHTAPAAASAADVRFVVTTCHGLPSQDCPEGYKIYGQMLALDPDFMVHTGDIVYYDFGSTPHDWARSIHLARYHWWRTYSLPGTVEFHRLVTSYFIKDDHDAWQNDCWPTMKNKNMGDFTFAEGLEVFREQVPMGDSTYRTFRWGKDLQIWLVEGRDFRSPNTMPDGPEKSIWGEEQKAWFKRTVEESDATFRVLLSPTPLVGPDRKNKRDNHSNKVFAHEGNELRTFISGQKNMVTMNGDRHWQYHSVDPKTGLREYSCGSCSDKHAGGWGPDEFIPEYHRYLRVKGGFLSGTLDHATGKPRLTLRFHDVDGKVRHEDQLVAE
ncbi:MAG: alkaline phosphatase D family protein [Planctomycetota bacterium]